MNLTLRESGELVYIGFYVIGLLLPLLAYGLLRWRIPRMARRSSAALSVLIVWPLLCFYMLWTLDIRIAYHMLIGDRDSPTYGMWDGTGENSFLLLFGWIFPSVSLLIFFCIAAVIGFIGKLCRAN